MSLVLLKELAPGALHGNEHCACCDKWATKPIRPKPKARFGPKFRLVWDDSRRCSCSGPCECKELGAPS